MKTARKVTHLAVTLIAVASFTVGANAALTLSIDEYTADSLRISISGSFDTSTVGHSPGYLAIKNDWINNSGTHTEMFLGTPDISLNTITIGGLTPLTTIQGELLPWMDNIFFDNPLGTGTPFAAGTIVSGSITLTGTGLFDPAYGPTLNLVSGFVRPFGPGLGDDWARLEAVVIPEPSSAVLIALAVGILATFFWRRKLENQGTDSNS